MKLSVALTNIVVFFFTAIYRWCSSQESEPDLIDPFKQNAVRILAITWNLAGKTPSREDLHNLLHPGDIHHDIYAIGT